MRGPYADAGRARARALLIVLPMLGGTAAAQRGLPAAGLPFREAFDSADALSGWEHAVGAHTGDGPASAVRVAGGALVLEGRHDTKRWSMLTRRLDVRGATELRFSARMRTESVDPSRARYRNCNLFVRFPGGRVLATQRVEGTHGWRTVSRRVPVPQGATEVLVACFLSMPGRAFFDDVVVEAVEPVRWWTTTCGPWVYHVPSGHTRSITEEHMRRNRAAFEEFAAFLGVRAPEKVHFYKYPDVRTKAELTGVAGNAFARPERREVHTVWPVDRHEIVHVLALSWGTPPALLGEGLAVHLSGAWQGEPVSRYARGLLRSGEWVPLEDLLDTASFRKHPDLVTYPISGAFVGWVLANHGKDRLKELYGRLRADLSADRNRALLEDVLGTGLDDVEAALRESLGGGR